MKLGQKAMVIGALSQNISMSHCLFELIKADTVYFIQGGHAITETTPQVLATVCSFNEII
jgi:hypothetical protein